MAQDGERLGTVLLVGDLSQLRQNLWQSLAALGLGLAVATLVIGRILGTLELMLLGATIGALVLITVAFIALSRLRISVDRELHPPRVHAGSPSRVPSAASAAS